MTEEISEPSTISQVHIVDEMWEIPTSELSRVSYLNAIISGRGRLKVIPLGRLWIPVNPMRLLDDPKDVVGGKCVADDEDDLVSPMN